jgi:chorismate mutase
MCAARWVPAVLCACVAPWIAAGCGDSPHEVAPQPKVLRRMGPAPTGPQAARNDVPLILNDDGRPRPPVESTPEERAQVERLLEAVDSRLAVMPDVARWKWNAKQPVEDPPREYRLLQEVSRQAVELGVPEPFARDFVTAQIVAARRMQQDAFEVWQNDPSTGIFADVPDLKEVLRPRIDERTEELLAALAEVEPWRGTDVFRKLVQELAPKRVRTPGTTAAIRTIAVHPLLVPRLAPEPTGDPQAAPLAKDDRPGPSVEPAKSPTVAPSSAAEPEKAAP